MFCYRLLLFFFNFCSKCIFGNKTQGLFMHFFSHSFSLPGPTASLFPAEPTAPVLAAESWRSLQCGQVKPGEGELGVWTMPSFPACWVNAKLEVSRVLCFRITKNTEPLFWGEMVSLSLNKWIFFWKCAHKWISFSNEMDRSTNTCAYRQWAWKTCYWGLEI